MGLKLDIQSRDWWLRPPFRDIPLARGFGLGLLEGWETIVVDGAHPLRGTGAEDYFLGGFYFGWGPFCAPTHGCTTRSFLAGRVSAYRFHVDDPIPFEQSLAMTIDHGLKNAMVGDYTSVAFWYQHEPHEPFAALPALAERLCRRSWLTIVQWLIAACVFGSFVAAIAYVVFRALR